MGRLLRLACAAGFLAGCGPDGEIAADPATALTQAAPPIANPPLTGDCASGDLDVWVIMDASGSTTGPASPGLAVEAFVTSLVDTGARVGVVSLNNLATVLVPMTPVTSANLQSTFAAPVLGVTPTQNTNLHAAYLEVEAQHLLDPADLVVAFSNGVPNLCLNSTGTDFSCVGDVEAATRATRDVVNRLRADDVRTMFVGAGMEDHAGVLVRRELSGRAQPTPSTARDLNLYDQGGVPNMGALPPVMGFIGRRVCPSAL